MTTRPLREPSPVRSAFFHGGMGLLSLIGVLGLGGGAVHLTGDADAASPTLRVALFETNEVAPPDLNPRLPADGVMDLATFASLGPAEASGDEVPEPDLGVDYSNPSDDGLGETLLVSANPADRGAFNQSVRINGRMVLPGQSFSQVDGMAGSVAGIKVASVQVDTAQAPEINDSLFERNARAFANADNRPTVSIIVGGLGINAGRTQAVIDELPAEVTLSFAPTTNNLQSWINKARAAGHEVLIELPMEAYEYDRERPHAQVLQVSADAQANTQRLSSLLGRANGYVGVMNYQGGKFATSQEAAQPVFDMLGARGMAFFEDGSLTRSVFEAEAAAEGVRFGRAGAWIDARPEADEITDQLMMLEAQALEGGSALGVGMPWPVTVDILKEWLVRLDEKGLALAPASHFARRSEPSGQVVKAGLDSQG